jgi:hypothetical protein
MIAWPICSRVRQGRDRTVGVHRLLGGVEDDAFADRFEDRDAAVVGEPVYSAHRRFTSGGRQCRAPSGPGVPM